MKFNLLAPRAPWVKLEGSWLDEPLDMKQTGEGWWRIDVPVPDGTHTYAFQLLSQSPFSFNKHITVADPLASLICDAQSTIIVKDNQDATLAYDWQKPVQGLPQNDELSIYELHVAEFGSDGSKLGTFKDVEQRLDYLQSLGINTIELMPVMWFPEEHGWGYNVRFPCAIHQAYGSPQDLQHLIEACHSRGMRVILDIVFNHAEQYSPLTQIDYDYWFRPDREGEESFGPKFDYETLDPYINDVAATRFNLLVAAHWIQHYQIDGFRIDAAAILNNYSFIYALHQYSHQRNLHKPFIVIAEQLPEDPTIVGQEGPADSAWHQGFEFEVERALIHGDNTKTLAQVLDPATAGYMFSNQIVNYVESHDEHAIIERMAEAGITGEAAQRKAAMIAVLLYTAVGNPMIYQGQEFGGFRPRDKVVKPLQWGLLDSQSGQALHQLYQNCIKLRNQHPALRSDSLRILSTEDGILIYQRQQAGQQIVVAVNLHEQEKTASLPIEDGHWTDLLSKDVHHVIGDEGLKIEMGPSGFKIIQQTMV